ncbi:MAG: hypothetical protein ABT00_21555 [Bordetella sp. SCN 68-11]|nr:MAG: hypothetical protein ABT00_21555 [Bordetella sp. SCN 68-11]
MVSGTPGMLGSVKIVPASSLGRMCLALVPITTSCEPLAEAPSPISTWLFCAAGTSQQVAPARPSRFRQLFLSTHDGGCVPGSSRPLL